MVHISYTQEPKSDKEGLIQTKTLSQGKPTTISLF